MTQKEKDGTSNRRDFLKLAALAAPAAAAATTGKAVEAAESDNKAAKGLRKTAHTKAYYDSARF